MSRQRYTVSIDVEVDIDAWQAEYGGGVAVVIADAEQDLGQWADRYYTEPKWDGLVVAKTVHVRRQGGVQ